MTEENHTIRLLTEMRNETRGEFKNVHERLQGVDAKLEAAAKERNALRQRMVESEVRTATELLGISGALDEIKALIRQQASIKMVVHDHERRIRKLESE